MFALDIIRYNGSGLSQFMGPYFNSRQMPSFSVVSNPSFSVLSYGIALPTFTTLFSFLLHDPFPNRGLGAVSPDEVNHVTTGLSLTYAVFPSPFRDVTATPSSLFAQSTLDSTISLVGTHTPNHVGTVFTAEVSHTGMAELTAVLTDPLFIHSRAHPHDQLQAPLLPLARCVVRRALRVHRRGDGGAQARGVAAVRAVHPDLRAAMHVAFGGEFPLNATVSFWREIFEYHQVTAEHDELWTLFLDGRKPDYFMSIEDIAEMEAYFARNIGISLW